MQAPSFPGAPATPASNPRAALSVWRLLCLSGGCVRLRSGCRGAPHPGREKGGRPGGSEGRPGWGDSCAGTVGTWGPGQRCPSSLPRPPFPPGSVVSVQPPGLSLLGGCSLPAWDTCPLASGTIHRTGSHHSFRDFPPVCPGPYLIGAPMAAPVRSAPVGQSAPATKGVHCALLLSFAPNPLPHKALLVFCVCFSPCLGSLVSLTPLNVHTVERLQGGLAELPVRPVLRPQQPQSHSDLQQSPW